MTGSLIVTNAGVPSQLLTGACMQTMDPAKDVDGFHPLNVGRLLTRGSRPAFVHAPRWAAWSCSCAAASTSAARPLSSWCGRMMTR